MPHHVPYHLRGQRQPAGPGTPWESMDWPAPWRAMSPRAAVWPCGQEPAARFRAKVACMRKYVIMGIQGSGKGTHAKMLAGDF